MPLNVGTVEAVLAARDTMSPVFVKAAETVLQLQAAIKALADSASPELANVGAMATVLQTQLAAAEAEFTRLAAAQAQATISAQENAAAQAAQAAAAQANTTAMETQAVATKEVAATNAAVATSSVAAAAGQREVADASTQAGQSMTQVEGIATRLIERLLILYAIRGGFQFVEGLFEAADILVKFHDQLGVSIQLLQEIQYTAERTDVPFNTITAAVDHLDKGLAAMKATVFAALHDIGLEFGDIFAMNPDERFRAVVAAIAAMPDQLARTRAEVALLGSDAIDPLITQFRGLSEEAERNGAILNDNAVNGMSSATRAFKLMGTEIEGVASWLLYLGQTAVAVLAGPLFTGTVDSKFLTLLTTAASGDVYGSYLALKAATAPEPKGDINLPGPTGIAGPYLVDPETLKLHRAVVDQTAESTKVLAIAEAGYDGVLATTNADVLEAIRYDLEHKAAISDIARVYSTALAPSLKEAEEKVRLVQQAMRDEAQDEKDAEKELEAHIRNFQDAEASAGEMGKVWKESFAGGVNVFRDAAIATGTLQLGIDYTTKSAKALHAEFETWNGLAPDLSSFAVARMREARETGDAFKEWTKDLTELTRAFRDLASVSDGSFKGVVQDVAKALAAAEIVAKGIETFNKGRDNGNRVQEATGLVSLAAGAMAATSGGTAQATAGGALTGAEIGFEVGGPMGALVGSFIGAAAGAIRSVFRDHMPEDIARDAGSKFGETWSDNLQKSILARAKALHDEVAGEIQSLPQIIAEHPIDTSNLDMYEGKVHDIFSMIEQGHFTVAQATQDLDAIFPSMAAVATDSYGRISDKLKEIISLNEQFGTQSKAIADWQKAQGSSVLSGANAITSALIPDEAALAADYDATTSKLDDANATIADLEKKKGTKAGLTHAQAEHLADLYEQRTSLQSHLAGLDATIRPTAETLGEVGSAAVGGYVTAVATGTSRSDALKAESDTLTRLEAEYHKLGIAIDDTALASLFMMNDVQKAAPALIAGIDGVTKSMVGLDNLNLETADSFKVQQHTASDMYTRVQGQVAALYGSTRDALVPMQEYLHQAEIEAKKLGVPLEANTQMMIDQSRELGIWDDNFKPVRDTTERLADAIERLVNWLNRVPGSVNTDVNADVHWNFPGANAPGPGQPDIPTQGPGAATGGLVYQGGVQYLASGGSVGSWWTNPVGTDTQPIMATPGEGIVSKAGMANIGGALGLGAINGGSGYWGKSQPGGDTTIHMSVSPTIILSGGDVDDPDKILNTIIEAGIRDNRVLFRTRLEDLAVKAVAKAA